MNYDNFWKNVLGQEDWVNELVKWENAHPEYTPFQEDKDSQRQQNTKQIQMTTFLTKAQRQILIDWYIDCLIETESEFVDGSEEAERQSLASMNNSYFYEYVQEMMPNCMEDLAKMKRDVTVQEVSQGGLRFPSKPVILHSYSSNSPNDYHDDCQLQRSTETGNC